MKSFYTIVILMICSPLYASNNKFEFNIDNLTLLALKNSTPEIFDQYVLQIVNKKHRTEFYQAQKKGKSGELLAHIKQSLMNDMKQISFDSHFLLAYQVAYKPNGKNTKHIDVSQHFKVPQTIVITEMGGQGLPDFFTLLFKNFDKLKDIKVKQDLAVINTKKLYVELDLVLKEFVNNRNFQTIISEIKVYDSVKKDVLIGSYKETRDFDQLIKDSLLPFGITNKLIGIHAFSLFGYRLQDQLLEYEALKSSCKKMPKKGKHQIVICKKEITQNSLLIVTYVGGRAAQIDLVAINELTTKEKSRLKHALSSGLKLSQKIFQQTFYRWNKYSVDFEMFSDAFYDRKSIDSTYFYPSIKTYDPSIKKHTLIVTMMSEATKKILELEN